MQKVRVYDITFQQNDYDIDELLEHFNISCLSEVNEDQLFEYLSQWDNCGGNLSEYDSNIYNIDQINTDILGYTYNCNIDTDNKGYLLSINYDLNYIGLSYFVKIKE